MGDEAMKIRVVTGYDGECVWRDLLEANLREYCDRWGYDLVMKFDGWGPTSRNLVWRKAELIRENFAGCDWLVWLDADCFVMNMTTPLTQYMSNDFDLGVTGPFAAACDDIDCHRKTKDAYSAGLIFLRQSEWSRNFLEEWWRSDETNWRPTGCGPKSVAGAAHLGDSGYVSCVLMQDPEQRKHITVFPLKEIGWANIAHDPSQFIAHCYGSLGHHRRIRFQQYEQHTVR
jgi:hypothetical protein